VKRVVGTLFMLVLLAFALPALFHAIEALIVPMIMIVFILGLGVFLFQRRRRW
jgi:hypothetical protein